MFRHIGNTAASYKTSYYRTHFHKTEKNTT